MGSSGSSFKCVTLSRLLAFECTLNHCTFISFIHSFSLDSGKIGFPLVNKQCNEVEDLSFRIFLIQIRMTFKTWSVLLCPQIRSVKFSLRSDQSLLTEVVNRLTDWQTDRQTDRETDRLTDWQTDRLTDRQTDWQTDRQTDRQTDKQTDRQTDRHTNEHTEKGRVLHNLLDGGDNALFLLLVWIAQLSQSKN